MLCFSNDTVFYVFWFLVVTLSSNTSSPALMSRGIRLLMNQLNHRMPLSRPMILIVSFSRASFSYTTLFRMMATEYIQARVMKRGMERLITRRKLRQRTGSYRPRAARRGPNLGNDVNNLTCHLRNTGTASAGCKLPSSPWCPSPL